MSEKIFTIEMIDIDLADLDTDEFLGLTPTYLRSILLELKKCYEQIDSLQGKIDKAKYAMQRYCDEWPEWPYPDNRIDNVCDAYEEVCLALE